MNKWEIERLSSNCLYLPTAWNSQETQNITETLVPTMPSLSLVSEGITLTINSFRESIQNFSPWLHHFHHPFSRFLPLVWAFSSVHALANLFSIPKSEWVSQCKLSWELLCLKSSHFYHYVWDKDGQYIAYTSHVILNILCFWHHLLNPCF